VKTVVSSPAAPAAIGPYSQAIIAGDFVFASGQLPLDPATGQTVAGDIRDQTRQVLENLSSVLNAAGSSLDNAVKTTCFLRDLADFAAFNEVYATFFTSNPPARSTVQVARLPRDAAVEVEVVALLTR
jgi:2-iminobutanoate/2-iminopropanoate deaminase